MEGDNRPWSEQYRIAGERWADLEAAADLLETTKSSVLAQRCAELGDIPVNRAEQQIKASRNWGDHLKKIAEARKQANRAKIELDYIRMKFYEWQSGQANTRAELRTLGSVT